VVSATGQQVPVVVAGTAVGVLLGAVGMVQLGVSLRRMLGND
jgi:hypothetical protein